MAAFAKQGCGGRGTRLRRYRRYNLRPTIPLLPPRSFILHALQLSSLSPSPLTIPLSPPRALFPLLFSIMKANCATGNQETRASFRNGAIRNGLFPCSNRHTETIVGIFASGNSWFAFSQDRGETSFQMAERYQRRSRNGWTRGRKLSERRDRSDETRAKSMQIIMNTISSPVCICVPRNASSPLFARIDSCVFTVLHTDSAMLVVFQW